MTDDDVDTADEYFQTHTSAEVPMVGEPSAEAYTAGETSAEAYEAGGRPSAEVSWATFQKARPGSRPAICS